MNRSAQPQQIWRRWVFSFRSMASTVRAMTHPATIRNSIFAVFWRSFFVGRRLSIFLLCCVCSVAAAFALPPSAHHPLDALTPDEYWTAYRVLRAAGHVEESTTFAIVLFHEPPKQEVLAWKPGDSISRKADVVLFDKGHSYAAVVDITGQKID